MISYDFDIDSLKWSIYKIYTINIDSLIEKLKKVKNVEIKCVDGIYLDNDGNRYNVINDKISKKFDLKKK